MFGSGFAYFFITLLFCCNYSILLLNECFEFIEYDKILHIASSLMYGTHFILLIYLLFGRVWYIFKDTQYQLSLRTVYCFVIFCTFQLGSAASFLFVIWLTSNHDSSIFIAYLFG